MKLKILEAVVVVERAEKAAVVIAEIVKKVAVVIAEKNIMENMAINTIMTISMIMGMVKIKIISTTIEWKPMARILTDF